MARTRTSWICRTCGAVQLRWMGKCPDCGAWDALEEMRIAPGAGALVGPDAKQGLAAAWAAGSPAAGEDGDGAGALTGFGDLLHSPTAATLDSIIPDEAPRLPTAIGELDRVLGGGLVRGSVVLVGGEPGIGKSTLLLQAGARLAAGGGRVLYVTSEESARQVQLRAGRLDLPRMRGDSNGGDGGDLYILADTNLPRIVEQARKVNAAVMIIDSVQMIYKPDMEAAPGSVTQLRRCAMELVYLAKLTGMAIVLVGHLTKDGVVAGPRLLEHLVDAVLYFEGDRYHAHRVVRSVKNRFGTTLEIGLFEMTGEGLREVPEGAGVAAVIGESGRPGSVVCPVLHGTRCFLVEIQALTAASILGAAKRKVSGLDQNRLPMLIAVLEKHAELRLADQDVFTSAVGGLRIAEPAADLAVALAIAGAHLNRALPPDTIAVGEIGLGGEIRRVNHLEQRLREAARLGFKHAITPANAAAAPDRVSDIIDIQPAKNVVAAMAALT